MKARFFLAAGGLIGLLFFVPSLRGGVLVMDNFSDASSGNLFGGNEDALSGQTTLFFVSTTAVGNTGYSRGVTYDSTGGSYHGYRSYRNNVNLSSYRYVSFWIRGVSGNEKVYCLVDDDSSFPKSRVWDFVPDKITTTFQKVVIPTAAFNAVNFGAAAGAFKIEANSDIPSGAGTVYIDDIRFGTRPSPIWWDNFNDGSDPFNYGSNKEEYITAGGTVLSASYDNALIHGTTGYSYKINFTSGTSSDAVVLIPSVSEGIDLSTGTDTLSFYLRGDASASGKNLGIGLKDSTLAGGNGIEKVLSLVPTYLADGIPSSSFQEVRIPLADFSGINKEKIKYFQVWFQRGADPLLTQTTNFTVYIDNIQFVDTSTPALPTSLLSNGKAVADGTVFVSTNYLTVTAQTGAVDYTLEHVGLEYSANGTDWFRVAADTDVSDAAYNFTWYTTSITTGTGYRLRAFSEDVQGNRGVMNAFTGLTIVRSTNSFPAAISDLTALTGTNDGDVLLKWTAPGNDGTLGTPFKYLVKASSSGPIASSAFANATTFYNNWTSLVSAAQEEQRTVTGLLPSVTYWFAIKAQALDGNFAVWNSSVDVTSVNRLSMAFSQDLPPAAITSLRVYPVSPIEIGLIWVPPAPPAYVNDYASYLICRATAPFSSIENFVSTMSWPYSSADTSVNVVNQYGFLSGSTYYYRVATIDADPPLMSPLSNQDSTHTVLMGSGPALKIIHEPITKVGILNQDIQLSIVAESTNSIKSLFLFYRVKESTTYYFNYVGIGTPNTRYEWISTIPKNFVTTSGLEYYIVVRDTYNEISMGTGDSPISVSVEDGARFPDVVSGQVYLEDGNQADGKTNVYIPEGALDVPATITIKQEDTTLMPQAQGVSAAPPVAAFSFGPEGIRFQKPVAMSLRFVDLNPRDGIVDGTDIQASDLKIFWYDAPRWRPVGGKIDSAQNTVTANVFHFSLYAIFSANLTAEDSKPKERIITPNGDGINDIANFDNLSDNSTVHILDMNGRIVRTLSNMGFWDGKDENGDIVRNGVYVYQFEKNFETVSGTIAVAR